MTVKDLANAVIDLQAWLEDNLSDAEWNSIPVQLWNDVSQLAVLERDKAKTDEKIFSLNDLIAVGLITYKDIEQYLRYIEAKKFVTENFKGMF